MLDLLIVLAFIAYSITVGFLARKKASRGLGEYFLAGRSLKGWQAGTSMAATQFAADTPLLVAGLVATSGVFMVWRLWIYALAFLLLAFVFASHWQRSGVITDAELTELRYSGGGVLPLRIIKAIYYGTVLNCVILAMVLIAAVGIAELFLPWHQWLPAAIYDPLHSAVAARSSGIEITSALRDLPPAIATTNNIISILAILIFTALYSMTGGLRGVVATDLVQFAVAIIGTIAFAWIIAREVGGLGAISDGLVEQYGAEQAAQMVSFAPGIGPLLFPFLLLISLQWFFQFSSDGTGYLAQRSMACSDHRQARFAGITFAWLQILLRSLPWLLIAVGLLLIYPFTAHEAQEEGFTAARELMFVRGIDDLMPIGLRGLLLTGMLAALASTLDTHMNWGAGYWSNDLYKRFICQSLLKREPGGRELVIIARLSNVAILLIALLIMVNLDAIADAWHISLLFGAGVGSVLVLRWVWERINVWSEFAAMAASLLFAPLVMRISAHLQDIEVIAADGFVAEAYELAAMALASTLAAVIVTLLTPPTSAARLGEFYQRVKPVGFWQRTAARQGDDPSQPQRDLARDLGRMLLTAASLFLCLYGAGRLLIQHPERPWFIAAGALALGVILVPVWWRMAGAREGTGVPGPHSPSTHRGDPRGPR